MKLIFAIFAIAVILIVLWTLLWFMSGKPKA